MWSPVAAIKKSFRRSKASSSTPAGLPPPALLSEEDLLEPEANNNSGDEAVDNGNNNNDNENNNNNPDHADGGLNHAPGVSSHYHNHEHSKVSPNGVGGSAHKRTSHIDNNNNNNDNGNSDHHHHHPDAYDDDDEDGASYPNNDNPDNDDDDNNAPPSGGFNTRLSGFNTRVLADDDFGDVDYDDDDEEDDEDDDLDDYKDARTGKEEFDFAGESDDDLIDRAFFGVDVSDSDEGEAYFHEWYLMDDEEGFLAPILFEDGMNSHECDLYYISLEEDKAKAPNPSPQSTLARRSLPAQFRSALPLRRLEEEEADELPSCLRESKKRPILKEVVPLRRRSFGGLPALPELPEFYRAHSCPDLSTLHSPHLRPKVNFDTEVQVVSVYAGSDYPRKIRSNLWWTRKEIRASRKEASYERRKERRQREKDYAKDYAAGRGTF